jgi:protein N-lysine methyltransferase METTL21D
MFFYISFLRPPPIAPSHPLSITPQITNDLRTQLCPTTQHLFYHWRSPTAATTPAKLTTWRESNPYKEIPVPLPPLPRTGSWQLVLSADSHPVVDLDSPTLGQTPFPIASMPIVFSSSKQTQGKQEQIERTYSLRATPDSEAVSFVLKEQTSFDLDKASTSLLYAYSCANVSPPRKSGTAASA